MAHLLDTNVLVRLANTADARHAEATRAVVELHRRSEVPKPAVVSAGPGLRVVEGLELWRLFSASAASVMLGECRLICETLIPLSYACPRLA